MKRAIFLCNGDRFDSVFPQYIKDEISKDWSLDAPCYFSSDIGKCDFSDVVAIFYTWGMATLT